MQGVRDLGITIKHLSPGFRNTTEKQADFKSQCGLKTVVGLQILYSKCTADRSIGLATGSVYIRSTWTNPSLLRRHLSFRWVTANFEKILWNQGISPFYSIQAVYKMSFSVEQPDTSLQTTMPWCEKDSNIQAFLVTAKIYIKKNSLRTSFIDNTQSSERSLIQVTICLL